MSDTPQYNLGGEQVGSVTLPSSIFDIPPNHDLLHQVVTAHMANQRRPWAHAKMRSEVRGGGRKPWRQKGTGRARHGSIRSPLWVGGGVTFGPHNERNYTKNVNRKMRRRALQMALTSTVEDDELTVVESWALRAPKTRALTQSLRSLAQVRYEDPNAFEDGVLLVVGADSDSNDHVRRAAQNVPWIDVMRADSLNAVAVLSRRYIIVEESALAILADTFGQL